MLVPHICAAAVDKFIFFFFLGDICTR